MLRIHNFARGARGLRVMWLCEEMGLLYEVKFVTHLAECGVSSPCTLPARCRT